MTTEQVVRLLKITKLKGVELIDQLIEELGAEQDSGLAREVSEMSNSTVAAVSGYEVPWELPDDQFVGDWEPEDPISGVTYRWPDDQFSEFEEFIPATGSGDFDGMTLGLGYETNGNVVGFVVGQGGSRRGITVFYPAADFASSNEKLSMIRGGPPRGRSGFGPGDVTPTAYDPFRVEILGDRIPGKWKVQAVVADADDAGTMLAHTMIQGRLRGLV